MRSCLRCFMVLLSLLILWQGIILIFSLPDYILPPPWQVFLRLYQKKMLILKQAWPTLLETGLGFSLGILSGIVAGIIIAFSPFIRKWFLPMLIISQAIPTFVIAPLFVIWLGFGLFSKIMITIVMIFFPVMSAFHDGLTNTPNNLLALAKTMQASPWRTFLYIRLPYALPELAAGIKIAAVMAPIGAIVGEWVGSSRGLGYLMLNANARLQIDDMFAALLIIILLALLLYFSVDRLLRRLIWWTKR